MDRGRQWRSVRRQPGVNLLKVSRRSSFRDRAVTEFGLVEREHYRRVERQEAALLSAVVQLAEQMADEIETRRMLIVGVHDVPWKLR